MLYFLFDYQKYLKKKYILSFLIYYPTVYLNKLGNE